MTNWSNNYYGNRLPTDAQREAYSRLCSSWRACQSVTSVKGHPSFSPNDVVEAAALDHPELFWVDYYRYSIVSHLFGTDYRFRFFYRDEKIAALRAEAEAWRRRVIAQVNPALDVNTKLWLIYDYLARQVTYGNADTAEGHTISGVFMSRCHTAVCEGIAKSCKYLCDGLNIPCITVSGDVDFGGTNSGPHAWNIVESSDGMRHMDITAQLQAAQFFGKASRINFLMKDRKMKKYTWDRTRVPVCE